MSFDDMLAETAAIAGVSVEEVGRWRFEDWQRHLDRLEARHIAMTADIDRAEATLADAVRCGCQISVEVDGNGEPAIGTGRVVHTCGRRSS